MTKKENLLVIGIIVVIVVSSILYFSFKNITEQPEVNPNIKTYNGFVFEKQDNCENQHRLF